MLQLKESTQITDLLQELTRAIEELKEIQVENSGRNWRDEMVRKYFKYL